jgi:alpha-L-rhamnosidase
LEKTGDMLAVSDAKPGGTIIPPAYVNTVYFVKSLELMIKIARLLGKDGDIATFEKMIARKKAAIKAAYFNPNNGTFIGNQQGANAFALDIGLGDARTKESFIAYYEKYPYYDTGIFATDILTRLLFERGDGELAVDLMTGDGPQGFEHWRKNGATTFHEYWDSNRSRSHNHPMFGAVTAYLLEHILGIGQKAGTAGYGDLVIEPKALARFGYVNGSMQTPGGTVSADYRREGDRLVCRIRLPQNTTGVFRFNGRDYPLTAGENRIEPV